MKRHLNTTAYGPGLWVCVVAAMFSFPARAEDSRLPDTIVFNRDIRPILSDTCFKCHGFDAAVRKADLRLDTPEGAFATRKDHTPIVPGKPMESEAYLRVVTDDADDLMPPPDSKMKLTDHQKALLKKWIEQGARYDAHWSLIPPVRPGLPRVEDAAWARNAIDRFILARLESQSLKPSPQADRATLIRRVYLDLTGLPPTLAQQGAAMNDPSPVWYESLVDRLLDSPRFGEHAAVDWLDASRYADTHGYHIDSHRDMWPWRDWVIAAINRNVPFDQFTTWQLAGDLLPEPTHEQVVATGFNRNHMINYEGGAIPEEYHAAYIMDRVNTLGSVWLGLTIGCAQCHDHKYDPITQKDYYRLYAFFHNISETPLDGQKGNAVPFVKLPSPEQTQRLLGYDGEITVLESQKAELLPQLDTAQIEWERQVLSPEPGESNGGSPSQALKPEMGSWHSAGPFFHPEGGARGYKVNLGPEGRPVDLSAMYFLAGKELGWVERPQWTDGMAITLEEGEQAVTYLYRKIRSPIKGKISVGFGSDDAMKVWLNRKPVVEFDGPRAVAADQHVVDLGLEKGENELLIKVVNYTGGCAFYFAVKDDKAAQVPQNIVDLIKIEHGQRTGEQRTALTAYYRNSVADHPRWLELNGALAAIHKDRAELDAAISTTMVMKELDKPRDTFMLMRGEYDKKGERVEAGVPASLGTMPAGAPTDRLGLAQWLTSPDHPLVARVIVNRYWQQYFGFGIVKTAEDFGSQGEWPVQPELLDWLATEFVRTGWDVKRMHRLIVTSAAYRQSSFVTPESFERDPENRLLARGPRFRLSAETIRDQALFVGGLLHAPIGGPSVSPYQPAGLWEEMAFGGPFSAQKYVQSTGKDLYRRTMYTFWKRTVPPATLSTFDAPDREICTVRRLRTNTPLQALVLMNDPTYVEASRKLAERVMREGGADLAGRLDYAFAIALARAPRAEEAAVVRAIYEQRLQEYRNDESAARQLLGVGESPRDESLDAAELAAWASVASVLLSLDETLTKG